MKKTIFFLFLFAYFTFWPSYQGLMAAQFCVIDTVYVLVLRPNIDKPHNFSKPELEKLDDFNQAFKLSFQQQFQLLSGKQCPTYYQVIDHENRVENKFISDLYDVKGVFRRPHYEVHGMVQRETDGYRLYLNIVGMPDNLILISHIVFFPFSKADDTQIASQEGIKAAQIMLDQLCSNRCQPKVVNTIYNTKQNVYYQHLLQLFQYLKIYTPDSDDADEMDKKISNLIDKEAVKQDEMFLSHSVIQALFWKNIRHNPTKALVYLTEAKEFYCRKTTSSQDFDLLRHQFNFDQFDEFIQNQIDICTPH